MKNFIQPGRIVEVLAPANVKSGEGVLVGSLFGVAEYDAVLGEPVAIVLEGVFTLPKTSAQAWSVGAKIYWDGVKCTTADGSGSNTLIGHALAVAANPSAAGIVRLFM